MHGVSLNACMYAHIHAHVCTLRSKNVTTVGILQSQRAYQRNYCSLIAFLCLRCFFYECKVMYVEILHIIFSSARTASRNLRKLRFFGGLYICIPTHGVQGDAPLVRQTCYGLEEEGRGIIVYLQIHNYPSSYTYRLYPGKQGNGTIQAHTCALHIIIRSIHAVPAHIRLGSLATHVT